MKDFEILQTQRAKKVVPYSQGLVDFAIRLVNYVLNLPERQVNFFGGDSNYCRTVIGPTRSTCDSGPAHQIFFRAS